MSMMLRCALNGIAHPLDLFLRVGHFAVLRELEIFSAIVSRAAWEAADPRECQDCFQAYGCDDIPGQMLRHLIVELPPVLQPVDQIHLDIFLAQDPLSLAHLCHRV